MSELDDLFAFGGSSGRLFHDGGDVVEYQPANESEWYPITAILGEEMFEDQVDEDDVGGRYQLTVRTMSVEHVSGGENSSGYLELDADGKIRIPFKGGYRVYSIGESPGGGSAGITDYKLYLSEALVRTRPGHTKRG